MALNEFRVTFRQVNVPFTPSKMQYGSGKPELYLQTVATTAPRIPEPYVPSLETLLLHLNLENLTV